MATDGILRLEITGGSCLILPVHLCTIWAAQRENVISFNALKVWFAAQEVKFWRCKAIPGQPYRYQLKTFQPKDMGRILQGMSEQTQQRAFTELQSACLLSLTDTGITFIEDFNNLNLSDAAKQRARSMFDQLHPETRDKPIAFPRRFLKLIIQCGKRVVRVATLMGMLLTTILTKRTSKYGGYKGCCKAAWIASVFGVNAKRVNSERARLIDEGWFTREPTTVNARKKYGQWVRLNLDAAPPVTNNEQPAAEASATADVPQVQPQSPPKIAQVQPLLNQSLPPNGVIENNQSLARDAQTPGVEISENIPESTWKHIRPEDLCDDQRSDALWQKAIDLGHLKATEPDRLNFFAAISHTLRVAKTNACGLLRTVVEKGLWQFISQADEHNAIERLRRVNALFPSGALAKYADSLASPTGLAKSDDKAPVELSEDARIAQTLTADLDRVGVTGDAFRLARRYGYLRDWDQARWDQAQAELAQARLLWARRQSQGTSFTSLGAMMATYPDEDRDPDDGF